MTLALFLAALRRHPSSSLVTALLVVTFASLLGVSAPTALAVWASAALLGLELWCVAEPVLLRRLGGCRRPTYAEREPIAAALNCDHLEPLIDDDGELAIGRGLRYLVVGRDLMDVLESRALDGLIHQAARPTHVADTAGVLLVWLGNLPLVTAWLIGRGLGQLGRMLGVLVGTSLVLPLVLWPHGFVQWSGRLFGGMICALLAAMLLSDGFAAAGLALSVAWAGVPMLRMALDWESRCAERIADLQTIETGFGQQLLEALECLALAEPLEQPRGLRSILFRRGAPLAERADRIRHALDQHVTQGT